MKSLILLFAFVIALNSFSQSGYEDSMKTYLANYVKNHDVVKSDDKRQMKFYDVNKSFRVVADFKPSSSANWIRFKTSGTTEQVFRVFGTATIKLNGKNYSLNIYQSQDLMTNPQYRDYLFLPFTDLTSGNETYIGGRYIDLTTDDVQNNKVTLDFNKAYNPYCAYVSGVYNCPIPPKENALSIAIKAGEKAFTKKH
ncbi:MAG: DUF1684 domain-containing protein [Chitinophagaceae bacterium]|nr:MAG: DUF1684 domain-containing protein [Chitinophagaceae bacterium]